MTQPIWQPSEERIRQARLTAFQEFVHQQGFTKASDYDSLHAWSVDQVDQFWPAVWRFCEVRSSEPWTTVVDDPERMPGARWFEGARLNFAENLLGPDRSAEDESDALVLWNEEGRREVMSFRRLHEEVARSAAALRRLGVVAGDRVAGFMPNLPQTVVAMLATTSLGALWSSCSPDFGVRGVIDRFGQIAPKVLFAADGYTWAGKPIDSLGRVAEFLDELPSVEAVVVVPYRRSAEEIADEVSRLRGSALYEEFLGSEEPAPPLTFAQLPFDHPLYVMYSSGTTGLPKCMVHGAGGTLLQHVKELSLHADVRPGDRIFYYTTCGWMMWNWLVSSLALGATVVLYEGSPFHAEKDVLWSMAEAERVTHFGISAKYLALAEKEGVCPSEGRDLSALRTLLSTGSPLAPESYDYVYREIKADLCLSSISGGTDIISCFALGNPTGPVYRGELRCGAWA